MQLDKCSACGGFVAPRSPKCPHCAVASPVKVGVGTALLGGAIAFTLMACYGMPPQPRGPEIVPPTPEPNGADAGSPIEVVPPPTTTPTRPPG